MWNVFHLMVIWAREASSSHIADSVIWLCRILKHMLQMHHSWFRSTITNLMFRLWTVVNQETVCSESLHSYWLRIGKHKSLLCKAWKLTHSILTLNLSSKKKCSKYAIHESWIKILLINQLIIKIKKLLEIYEFMLMEMSKVSR